MSFARAITGIFNGLRYGGRDYDRAVAAGETLDITRVHYATGIMYDATAAFLYKKGDDHGVLIFRENGKHMADTLTLDKIRHMLQKQAFSNYHRISEMIENPKAWWENDVRHDLLAQRQEIEKSIALFETRTGRHVKDPIRHHGFHAYMAEAVAAEDGIPSNAMIDLAIEAAQDKGGEIFTGDLKTLPRGTLKASVEAQAARLFDWVLRN